MIDNIYFKSIKSPKMTKKSKILPLVDSTNTIINNSGIYKKYKFHIKCKYTNCKFCYSDSSKNGG